MRRLSDSNGFIGVAGTFFSLTVELQFKIRSLKCVAAALLLLVPTLVNAGEAGKWQQDWEKTLEAAKKEGQVVVYISGYEAILPDFEKEFPEIKVIAVTGRGNQLGPRLLAERRGEKFIADVSSTGANPNYQQFHPATALDPIKPALILPEVTDQSKWYLKKHQYSDPGGQYVFNYVASTVEESIHERNKSVQRR